MAETAGRAAGAGRAIAGVALAGALLALGACGREAPAPGPGPRAAPVTVWAHAGQEAERRALEAQAARYNASGPVRPVRLSFLPEGGYNAQVQAAALAGDLPCLLELDGPYLAHYVWQGRLRPLDGLLPAALREDLLPSVLAQGRYRGRLYGVGTFDSGLGLYGRRSLLDVAGAELPEGPGEAWPVERFEALLERLAEADPDGAVLDLGLQLRGEWYTYAFAPALHSAGGGLLAPGPDGRLRAHGVLDGPASVAALERIQGWIRRGRVDPNLDEAAFASGRVALAWGGHWDWPRYREAWGEDLVLLPLPDFGQGSRTGQGSWVWTVTASCPHPEAAAAFLRFLLRPEEILAMTAANAAVPARRSAVARSPLYGPGGPLRLFAEQLAGGRAVPRPRTAAYPVVTAAFQEAFAAVRDGLDVAAALRRAAEAIDRELAEGGYGAEAAGT